mgnify:CR=1 FL=1
MREMIKMVIVLTVLSCFSGGVLAYLRNSTQERIDNQVLEFVKGPAVRTIFEGADNNPIADRFTLKDGDVERTFFVADYDGEPRGIAFETSGSIPSVAAYSLGMPTRTPFKPFCKAVVKSGTSSGTEVESAAS